MPNVTDQNTGLNLNGPKEKPQILILINNTPLFKNDATLSQIKKVEFYEEVGCFSKLVISINNPYNRLTDYRLFAEGSIVNFAFGTSQQARPLINKFILQKPRVNFETNTIDLICYDESVNLHSGERRVDHGGNLRYSDVARKIAKEYGFDDSRIVVQDSELVYNRIIQSNESDYTFLSNAARLVGFDFFITDGVFHFHEAQAKSPQFIYTQFGIDNDRIRNLCIEIGTNANAVDIEKTGIDKETGKTFEVKSSIYFSDYEAKTFDNDVNASARQLTEFNGRISSSVYDLENTHLNNVEESIRFSDRRAEDYRWVIKASGEVATNPLLKPRSLISLVDYGRWSGQYFLTKVTHKLIPYNGVQFEARRSSGIRRFQEYSDSFLSGAGLSRPPQESNQRIQPGVVIR